MFGANFFRKNESPTTHVSPEQQERLDMSEKDLYIYNSIQELIGDDSVMYDIRSRLINLKETKSLFRADLPDTIEIEESPEKQEIEPFLDPMEPQEQLLEPRGPRELLPQSETDLITQIIAEYADSAFAQKAQEVLLRRGLDEDRLPEALEQLLTKIAQKCIEAFKGDITQILYESGFDELDAENYIYWRFNEYTEDNLMYLVTNGNKEALVADNFLTEELITLFQSQQEKMSGTPEEEREANIVTSEKIDELLNEIENA